MPSTLADRSTVAQAVAGLCGIYVALMVFVLPLVLHLSYPGIRWGKSIITPRTSKWLATTATILLFVLVTTASCYFLYSWITMRSAQPSPYLQSGNPPGVQPTTEPIITSPPFTIRDNHNREAKVQVFVFMHKYHWKKKTAKVVLEDAIVPDAVMKDYLSSIVKREDPPDALLCVGTASHDVEGSEAKEVVRAEERANKISDWLKEKITSHTDLYTLNLGRYRRRPDTDDQRLIILMRLYLSDPTFSIKEIMSRRNLNAFKENLNENEFPFQFQDYSTFAIKYKPR